MYLKRGGDFLTAGRGAGEGGSKQVQRFDFPHPSPLPLGEGAKGKRAMTTPPFEEHPRAFLELQLVV